MNIPNDTSPPLTPETKATPQADTIIATTAFEKAVLVSDEKTQKIVCFKFRQPKSNIPSQVDNDNQIFLLPPLY